MKTRYNFDFYNFSRVFACLFLFFSDDMTRRHDKNLQKTRHEINNSIHKCHLLPPGHMKLNLERKNNDVIHWLYCSYYRCVMPP